MADIFSDAPFAYPQGSFYKDLADRLAIVEAAVGAGAGAVPYNAVDTLQIKDHAVTAVKIANDTITAAQVAANAIGSAELADAAVDTAAIADANVTRVKLAADVYSSNAEAIAGVATVGAVTPAALLATASQRTQLGFNLSQSVVTAMGVSTSPIQIKYDTAVFDRTGGFTSGTWSIKPGAGIWVIGNQLELSASATQNMTNMIYLNGSVYQQTTQPILAAGLISMDLITIMVLGANDVLTFFVQGAVASGTKNPTINSHAFGVRIAQ